MKIFQYSNNAIKLLKSYYDERNLIDKFNEAMKNDYNVAMKLKEGEIVDYYDIIIKEYMVNNELKIVDIVTDVETVEILYYGFIVAHVIETIESEHVTRWKPLHNFKGRFEEFIYLPEKVHKFAKFLFDNFPGCKSQNMFNFLRDLIMAMRNESDSEFIKVANGIDFKSIEALIITGKWKSLQHPTSSATSSLGLSHQIYNSALYNKNKITRMFSPVGVMLLLLFKGYNCKTLKKYSEIVDEDLQISIKNALKKGDDYVPDKIGYDIIAHNMSTTQKDSILLWK